MDVGIAVITVTSRITGLWCIDLTKTITVIVEDAEIARFAVIAGVDEGVAVITVTSSES